MALCISKIVSWADWSSFIQSINVSHQENVRSIEEDQLIDATDIVSIDKQAVNKIDGCELVSYGDKAHNSLSEVADT